MSFAFALDQSLQHVLEVRLSDSASGAALSPLLSRWEPTQVAACSGASPVHIAEGATASVVLTAP